MQICDIVQQGNTRERIIVPLLRRALFYFGGAVVNKGPEVDKVSLIYYGPLVYYRKGPEQRVL